MSRDYLFNIPQANMSQIYYVRVLANEDDNRSLKQECAAPTLEAVGVLYYKMQLVRFNN